MRQVAVPSENVIQEDVISLAKLPTFSLQVIHFDGDDHCEVIKLSLMSNGDSGLLTHQ